MLVELNLVCRKTYNELSIVEHQAIIHLLRKYSPKLGLLTCGIFDIDGILGSWLQRLSILTKSLLVDWT